MSFTNEKNRRFVLHGCLAYYFVSSGSSKQSIGSGHCPIRVFYIRLVMFNNLKQHKYDPTLTCSNHFLMTFVFLFLISNKFVSMEKSKPHKCQLHQRNWTHCQCLNGCWLRLARPQWLSKDSTFIKQEALNLLLTQRVLATVRPLVFGWKLNSHVIIYCVVFDRLRLDLINGSFSSSTDRVKFGSSHVSG